MVKESGKLDSICCRWLLTRKSGANKIKGKVSTHSIKTTILHVQLISSKNWVIGGSFRIQLDFCEKNNLWLGWASSFKHRKLETTKTISPVLPPWTTKRAPLGPNNSSTPFPVNSDLMYSNCFPIVWGLSIIVLIFSKSEMHSLYIFSKNVIRHSTWLNELNWITSEILKLETSATTIRKHMVLIPFPTSLENV